MLLCLQSNLLFCISSHRKKNEQQKRSQSEALFDKIRMVQFLERRSFKGIKFQSIFVTLKPDSLLCHPAVKPLSFFLKTCFIFYRENARNIVTFSCWTSAHLHVEKKKGSCYLNDVLYMTRLFLKKSSS